MDLILGFRELGKNLCKRRQGAGWRRKGLGEEFMKGFRGVSVEFVQQKRGEELEAEKS